MEVENLCYKAIAKVSDIGIKKTEFPTGRKVLYVAPTQNQARQIIWEQLKNRLGKIGTPNEQFLSMKVPNADGGISTIMVGGWENRENYRGLADVVHITFDEVDTLKNFFIAWVDIFRPMFLDTSGTANFIGTPKKENPNLRRLEKELKDNSECFHFTSKDNPFLSVDELNEIEKDYIGNKNSYKQEILAEHVENSGALFGFSALIDMFSNTVTKTQDKYLIVDIADDGSDKTIFSFWHSLELYRIEQFERLNTEGIIQQIKEYASQERIPYSHIAVDAIGVGAGVASASALDGIIGFKSSYSAIRTDKSIITLPNVHYLKEPPLTTEYKNLRSQCVFVLADKINNHRVACRVEDATIKDRIIEELALYQDASIGDGKRAVTGKDDIKAILGRSPDISDTLIMRMYFELKEKMQTNTTEAMAVVQRKQAEKFLEASNFQEINSSK